ncbi:hypothetical protein CJ030_MR0G025139 [Morella rubra]|uniref:Uncharacterized protein n=1 Tax=Morella rubra TaxID=262757 RepID=A0A6A1UFQ6_9ROSI|nr:hypothetical protein CJ030_MR0G025139 [Morella rubra]
MVMENHLASISNSQRRGKTCGLALNKVRATQLGKLSVSIPDDCAADVGENSAKLSTQIGLLVRGTIPMATSSWNEVPPECKEKVRILEDFNLDYNREEDLQTENMIMAKSYHQFKGRLHEHYKKKGGGNKEVVVQHPHPDMDEDTWQNCATCLLIQNIRYIKGLKIFHTAGTRTFARYRKVLENSPSVTSDIGFAELYAASHKRKNGTGCLMLLRTIISVGWWLCWYLIVLLVVLSKLLEYFVACVGSYMTFLYSGIVPTIAVMLPDLLQLSLEKMRELQEQAISDGRSYTDIDILHQVLGPKPGYVRGLGRAVKPPRTSGSSSTSVARQLREAQLEIDRLKAEREAEVEQMRIEWEAEMERMRAERQQEMKELEDRLMREMRERMNDFMANSSHGL